MSEWLLEPGDARWLASTGIVVGGAADKARTP